jgi:superfamily II DNA/RNA helicase
MLNQGVDVVIATPGRLNDLLERGEVSVSAVKFVVLDEADQMADLGFLPQVRRVLDQIDGHPQTLLFSATLDGAVGELVNNYQRDPVHHEVRDADEEESAMEQRFIVVDGSEQVDATVDICARAKRSLVFVATTHGADRLAASLSAAGLKAAPIHGRLSQPKRERTLAQFRDASINVLVATNVAARGIHVDDVDVVIHFDPPEDAKVYLHRSGRTARAGSGGLVVTLVQPQQALMMTRLQREIGLDQELIQMRPGDPRLTDLASWQPPAAQYAPEQGLYSMSAKGGRRPPPVGRGRAPSRNRATGMPPRARGPRPGEGNRRSAQRGTVRGR